MKPLTQKDLMSLEEYHRRRDEFRAAVLAHKRNRQVAIGPSVTLAFEDRITMQYQVQEMLRIERIFEREAIEDELEAYNPLIPDGGNLKATMMIEFPDVAERRAALMQLIGIEQQVYVRVRGFGPAFAIADEDLERSDEAKTSAVHFLRFELTPEMSAALKRGAELSIGIDHAEYRHVVDPVPAAVRASLAGDFD
jgi:hypothetical protein